MATQLLSQALGQQQLSVAEQLRSQAATGPEGCEIVAAVVNPTNRPANFIWRFGVLLAADPAAHFVLPGLPLAPADEQRAVGT